MTAAALRSPGAGGGPQIASRAGALNWAQVAHTMHLSRAIDELEEQLCREGRIAYQFSVRGHDLLQAIVGARMTHPWDAFAGYYRSRGVLLALGVPPETVLISTLAKADGYSGGRDIGVVFNQPAQGGGRALPMAGGVGAQFSPAAGWAEAITYRQRVLGDAAVEGAICVAAGGDGSVATNGFWAALVAATTQGLPVLFLIEDNGLGLSTPAWRQTPGGDISANLAAFSGLRILKGDGADPSQVADLTEDAFDHVRGGHGPCLLHMRVPRLCGHSYQDTQAYRSSDDLEAAIAPDPLPRLRHHLSASGSDARWEAVAAQARQAAAAAFEAATTMPAPASESLVTHLFSSAQPAHEGGLRSSGTEPPATVPVADLEGPRINMSDAIRRTLDRELELNPRLVVLGQDVGRKGGVHGVTAGLQRAHGAERVLDTSLSEEGIVGRAMGMALCGLRPAAEIQFRKYAESAGDQISDVGSLRWRTRNRFCAPLVLRMPVGFGATGDPWHSQTNEAQFVHTPGWRVAAPSNAADAAGLLRTALRGDDPVIFLEHRALLSAASARAPDPGPHYGLDFGRAAIVRPGCDVTVVTWGAMVERALSAAEQVEADTEIIDLRSLAPWDQEAVLHSVRRTRRCLVLHEDLLTGGFGAEVTAVIGKEAFLDLDAPVTRLAMPDVPSPYAASLLQVAVPGVVDIADALRTLAAY